MKAAAAKPMDAVEYGRQLDARKARERAEAAA
jgi:hypothetical protein